MLTHPSEEMGANASRRKDRAKMPTRKEFIESTINKAFEKTVKPQYLVDELYSQLFLGEKCCGNCLHWKELYENDCIDPAEGHCRYLPVKHGGFPMSRADQCCRCHEFIVEIDGEVRDAK